MKKNLLLILSLCFFAQTLRAAPAIQRALGSSFSDYTKYLRRQQLSSFRSAYIELSSKMEPDASMISPCLENLYLGRDHSSKCLVAIKALTSRPLSSSGREVLFGLLIKIEKIPSAHQGFFINLKNGLAKTHPDLLETFHRSKSNDEKDVPSKMSSLEWTAWTRAIGKKVLTAEATLLINGQEVPRWKTWQPPEGVYQWTLVTNTHEPLVRLGTFTQFASESVKFLSVFPQNSCSQAGSVELKKFGLKDVEFFQSPRCVVKETRDLSNRLEHLGATMDKSRIESPGSSKHWLFPALLIIGGGIALGLQGKTVTVTGLR